MFSAQNHVRMAVFVLFMVRSIAVSALQVILATTVKLLPVRTILVKMVESV